jgi:hypothetical protein
MATSQLMSELLKPEVAAKLSAILFPDSDPETALVETLEWFDEYNNSRKGYNGERKPTSAIVAAERTRSWSKQPELVEPESEETDPLTRNFLPTGVYNNPEIKKMMADLVTHVRTSKISPSELQREIGASYPTILNWMRGKLPRGENIGKIRNYMEKLEKPAKK